MICAVDIPLAFDPVNRFVAHMSYQGRNWKTRFFELDLNSKRLQYFHKEGARKAGEVDLSDAYIESVPESKYSTHFRLIHGDNTAAIDLRAPSEKDLSEWLMSIQNAIKGS